MDPNTEEFIAFTVKHMLENNISVHLTHKKEVSPGVGGEFGEQGDSKGYSNGVHHFECATKRPLKNWLSVYVHESAHFLQYLDKDSIWHKGEDHVDKLFNWFDNEGKATKRDVYGCQMLELDCEKRAVELIKEYGLKLNLDRYYQESNAYLFIYNVAYETRKWPKKSPYKIPKIVDMMPTKHLNKTAYKKSPSGYTRLIKKHCY